MRILINMLWNPTNNIRILAQETWNSDFDRNPDPTFISETQTKDISNRSRLNDYNWITNQKYKIWMSQGRILDKFIVLEEPKETKPHNFYFYFFIYFIFIQ